MSSPAQMQHCPRCSEARQRNTNIQPATPLFSGTTCVWNCLPALLSRGAVPTCRLLSTISYIDHPCCILAGASVGGGNQWRLLYCSSRIGRRGFVLCGPSCAFDCVSI